MRRLLIAFVVLALLLWGSLWSSSTVERTVNEVVAALEADELEQAYALWMRAQSKFGALLLHDELDLCCSRGCVQHRPPGWRTICASTAPNCSLSFDTCPNWRSPAS